VTAREPGIVLCPDGPILLRGEHVVVDEDGIEHRTTRPVSAVCRCGFSAVKPWCDGNHKVAVNRAPRGTGSGNASTSPRWVPDRMTTTPQEPAPGVPPMKPGEDEPTTEPATEPRPDQPEPEPDLGP
jgi:CDGSH-type Zn-finger protein